MEKVAGKLFYSELFASRLYVFFFIHPAVSSQRIIPMKQQVIVLIVVAIVEVTSFP